MTRLGRLAWVAAAAWLGVPAVAGAQHATLTDYAARAVSELGTVQIRLAPLASVKRALPCVLLTTAGGDPDSAVFEGYERPGFPVTWNERHAVRARLSPEAMAAALEAIERQPLAASGHADSMGVYLMTLVAGRGESLAVYEATVERETGAELFQSLAVRAVSAPPAEQALAVMSCICQTGSGTSAQDLGGAADVTFDRFEFDPSRRELQMRLRVFNRSRAPIPGPVVVVLRPHPDGTQVLDPDGYTCRVFGPGVPCVRMPVTEALAPGVEVDRVVRIANPGQHNVRFEWRVFSGAPDR